MKPKTSEKEELTVKASKFLNFQIDETIRIQLEAIMKAYGFTSIAQAARFSINQTAKQVQ